MKKETISPSQLSEYRENHWKRMREMRSNLETKIYEEFYRHAYKGETVPQSLNNIYSLKGFIANAIEALKPVRYMLMAGVGDIILGRRLPRPLDFMDFMQDKYAHLGSRDFRDHHIRDQLKLKKDFLNLMDKELAWSRIATHIDVTSFHLLKKFHCQSKTTCKKLCRLPFPPIVNMGDKRALKNQRYYEKTMAFYEQDLTQRLEKMHRYQKAALIVELRINKRLIRFDAKESIFSYLDKKLATQNNALEKKHRLQNQALEAQWQKEKQALEAQWQKEAQALKTQRRKEKQALKAQRQKEKQALKRQRRKEKQALKTQGQKEEQALKAHRRKEKADIRKAIAKKNLGSLARFWLKYQEERKRLLRTLKEDQARDLRRLKENKKSWAQFFKENEARQKRISKENEERRKRIAKENEERRKRISREDEEMLARFSRKDEKRRKRIAKENEERQAQQTQEEMQNLKLQEQTFLKEKPRIKEIYLKSLARELKKARAENAKEIRKHQKKYNWK